MTDHLPRAYQYADEHCHHVCADCPDKEEADTLARQTEERINLEMALAGIDYVKRMISHTICTLCYNDRLDELFQLKRQSESDARSPVGDEAKALPDAKATI